MTFDLTQTPYPLNFDGQIIWGKHFPDGGIGGHGIYDPATGVLTYSEVDLVFCRKASGGHDD